MEPKITPRPSNPQPAYQTGSKGPTAKGAATVKGNTGKDTKGTASEVTGSK